MIDIDPVFNDLSCQPLASDKYEASKRMENFIVVLNEFPNHGLGHSLRTSSEFRCAEISDSYSISDWMFDPNSPQVERQLLITLATKSPLFEGLDSKICEEADNSEVSCERGISESLLVGYLMNLPLISLDHDLWAGPSIQCSISQMDDEGVIKDSSRRLINFSKSKHFSIHESWMEERRKADLQSLEDLWNQRKQLFPNLCFAKNVKAQLSDIPSSSDIAAQIIDRLFNLERVASLGQKFDDSVFRTTCSASSDTALKKFESAYSFKDDAGTTHLCGWHLKMQDGNRIYFADIGGRYLIGHIGRHLPTKKFD